MPILLLNSLFMAAFTLSAVVQYNDPDALVWIVIYLAAAVMCITHFHSARLKWLPPLLMAISFVWIGTLMTSIVGKVSLTDIFASITMKTREVEEAREIGGLLLVLVWSGFLSYRQRWTCRN